MCLDHTPLDYGVPLTTFFQSAIDIFIGIPLDLLAEKPDQVG